MRGRLRLGEDVPPLQDSIDILLRRVKHLLSPDDLLTLYKAQVRPVMEYAPLTWMSSARCHLNLLDKRQQWTQQTSTAAPALDCLEHRRKVAALTALHKAQVQHVPHLADLRATWRRSERCTRTVLSNDSLLEVSRSYSTTHQRAFTATTARLWNAFTTAVDIRQMSTQQARVAAHRWLQQQPS
ncbi:uncharacterized protein LOC135101791 [Scylla paramamosain]|uniref:uncharacterized protein LOC135101791 n=1 Tax=Scylla paramamosain TaxID=85552 RepID=UPI00308361CF